jgi:iron-regulated transporter 1
MWSLSWQMIWLTAGLGWLFSGIYSSPYPLVISVTGFAVCVALSRVGLWGFDLCAQMIIQDVSMFMSTATLVAAVKLAFSNEFSS